MSEVVEPKVVADRVKEIRKVPASSIRENPNNWRTHPEYQKNSLTKLFERIGFVGALLVRELPDGSLELIDGHLRREVLGSQDVTVLVTDLTEEEALEVLATYDQITTLATADTAKVTSLLERLKSNDVPLTQIGWPEYRLDLYLPTSPAFAPITNPEIPTGGGSEVTPEQIQQAEEELQDKFRRENELATVTCPHCANQFSVRPTDLLKQIENRESSQSQSGSGELEGEEIPDSPGEES